MDLSIIFLFAVILIWFMIAYQLVLTVAGFFHHLGSMREKKRMDEMSFDYPPVSILIPAHNEEVVIGSTIEAMLALEYPKEKLEVIVINDGSTDSTRQIVKEWSGKDPRIKLVDIPVGKGGRGKSRALNFGVQQTLFDIIAIYDADNTPAPDSLKYLVAQLILNPDLGAVIGKFRTVNRKRNLLTRFINIETLSFQSILQAGRWKLFRIATLPGTNFVIRKDVVGTLGGWDEEALTEDSELSIRMYIKGWRIKFIPYAVTYEQEPERWSVWLKQRTRWVRGANYVACKFLRLRKEIRSPRLKLEIFYLFSMYYVFFVAIVVSDLLFILGAAGIVKVPIPGPYGAVWILAVVLFFAEILLALSYDREDSPANLLFIALMYFTYCQLWLLVVTKAFYMDLIRRDAHVWVKTVRFRTDLVTAAGKK